VFVFYFCLVGVTRALADGYLNTPMPLIIFNPTSLGTFIQIVCISLLFALLCVGALKKSSVAKTKLSQSAYISTMQLQSSLSSKPEIDQILSSVDSDNITKLNSRMNHHRSRYAPLSK